MASVYIETTIPSFYHDSRPNQQFRYWRDATRLWWNQYRVLYDVYTSRFVLAELAGAPSKKASSALDLLERVNLLEEPEELADVWHSTLNNA